MNPYTHTGHHMVYLPTWPMDAVHGISTLVALPPIDGRTK